MTEKNDIIKKTNLSDILVLTGLSASILSFIAGAVLQILKANNIIDSAIDVYSKFLLYTGFCGSVGFSLTMGYKKSSEAVEIHAFNSNHNMDISYLELLDPLNKIDYAATIDHDFDWDKEMKRRAKYDNCFTCLGF
jgi:hypothetical protein